VSGAFPRRWRRAWPWACSCAVLLLAGCGGGGEPKAQEPRIPRGLAQAWADQARAIADRLDGDDACDARDLAHRLQRRTIREIARVPARFREDLQGAVNDLTSRTDDACAQAKPPPAPPPPPPPSSSTTTHETETTTETETETSTTSSTTSTTEPATTTEETTESTTTEETSTDDQQGDGG
jgi:hypothetical protein